MGLISRVSSRTYRHESKVAKEANAQIEAKATKDASTIQVIYWSRFQCIINNTRFLISSLGLLLLISLLPVFTDKPIFSLHTHSKTTPSVSDNKKNNLSTKSESFSNFSSSSFSCSIDIFRKFDLIS